MAYVADTYAGGHIAATDLQNIEGNFEFLRTNFKSGSSPADPGGGLEGVIWWDETNKLPKVRDASGWRGIFSGGASFKIWAYLDSVPDGWTRDSSVTDVVLGLKGGAVYTTGGNTPAASSWTISGLSSTAIPNTGWGEASASVSGRLAVGSAAAARPLSTTTKTPTISQDGAWRIKAAVGIMLYPKM